jgi:acetyl-CoA carboxylase biotin carboxyl carrier protein
LNLDELKALLQLIDEKDITEFELEHDGMKLRVRKGHPPEATPAPAPLHAAAPLPPPGSYAAPSASAPPAGSEPPAAPVAVPSEDDGAVVVKSPIVGTFYRAASPGSPAFVNVGDRVKAGQVLCIIEAMKLMNEIEAELAGEVVKIHHENGQPVQYGEALFSIRPER